MNDLYQKMPDTPGVYLMSDGDGRVLYVGKAGNLKRRVSSYFTKPHDSRIEKLVREIKKIDYRTTDTALEALILEAELIKKLKPPFNVREKDDKSFLYVEISKEKFPRVFLVRGHDLVKKYDVHGRSRVAGKRFGPFTSASSIREALRILRRIFPWSTHEPAKLGKFQRPCFDYELGLCPGTCVGRITSKDYLKNIKRLILFFEGKKERILVSLQKEMVQCGMKLEFEKAEKLHRQIFSLQHIHDIASITEPELGSESALQGTRIEGYDISNISGTSAVGSMVVFHGDEPDKNEYRKFKIRTITQADDTGMLKEVLRRRFANNWPLPALILVDGSRGQVNTAKKVIDGFGFKILIVGIAKGAKRKNNNFIGSIPKGITKQTLINIRNEAHRFAISYHKKLRSEEFINRNR